VDKTWFLPFSDLAVFTTHLMTRDHKKITDMAYQRDIPQMLTNYFSPTRAS